MGGKKEEEEELKVERIRKEIGWKKGRRMVWEDGQRRRNNK